MKHTGTNDDVCHAWANSPRQGMTLRHEDGRTENVDHMNRDNDRSLWFRGDTLYSYQTAIAVRYRDKGFCLLSEEKYSSTTGRHLSIAYSSIGKERKAEVPYIQPTDADDHLANMLKLWNDARFYPDHAAMAIQSKRATTVIQSKRADCSSRTSRRLACQTTSVRMSVGFAICSMARMSLNQIQTFPFRHLCMRGLFSTTQLIRVSCYQQFGI